MEQWLGCLAPVCQLALKRARDTVTHRGGEVVTAEDLLLALLDVDTALSPFLNRWGVDLDELVRTVQCEQPLSPYAADETGLSESLIDWLVCARSGYDRPWLGTHHLLSTLVSAERFQDKAYVAVLEQVPTPAWEALALSSALPAAEPRQVMEAGAGDALVVDMAIGNEAVFPLSSSAHDLASTIVTQIIEPRAGLLWLQSSSALRVEGLLGQVRRMAQAVETFPNSEGPALRRRWYRVRWESAGDDDIALNRLFVEMESHCQRGQRAASAGFLFQACSPAVLALLIRRMGILKWRHFLAVARPVLVLSSPALKQVQSPVNWLEDSLALPLQRFDVPLLSVIECVRYLRYRQPGLERRWHVEIADAALQAAAGLARARAPNEDSTPADTDPEIAVNLLNEALNAKLIAQANGSAVIADLRASREDLERRRLTAEARSEDVAGIVQELHEVCLELAAEEAHWNEYCAPTATVLIRNDVVRQALRRAGVPLLEGGASIVRVAKDEQGTRISKMH